MNAYVKDSYRRQEDSAGRDGRTDAHRDAAGDARGAAPVSAKSTATIKRAPLSGSAAFPAVNGEAKWKSKDGERELEVQIEDAKKLAGKRLTVAHRRQGRRPHEGQRPGTRPAGAGTRRQARACPRR